MFLKNTIRKSGIYWPRILFSYGIFILLGMNTTTTGLLLNEFAHLTGTNLKQVSWLFVVRSLGGLISALAGVHLYDSKSMKKILAFILMVFSLALFFIPLSKNLTLTMGLFLLAGFTHNMSDASGNLTVASSHKGNTGPVITLLHFTFGIGALTLPLLINLLKTQNISTIRIYWVIAAILFLCAIINLLLKNPDISPSRHKEKKQTPPVPFLIILPLFFLFYTGTEMSFSGWIYNFSIYTGFFTEKTGALLVSLFFGVFTGARLLMVPITAKVKPEKILLFSLTGVAIVFLLFTILPLSSWIVTGGIVLIGLFFAPTFPVFFSMIQQRFGLSGKLASFIMSGALGGGMLFPWLIGQFFESRGPIIMIYILTATSLINLTLFVFLINIKHKETNINRYKKIQIIPSP